MRDEPVTEPEVTAPPPTAAEEAERRRRRAHVFGEVLPEQTADDLEEVAGGSAAESEAWLKRQVPPHHG